VAEPVAEPVAAALAAEPVAVALAAEPVAAALAAEPVAAAIAVEPEPVAAAPPLYGMYTGYGVNWVPRRDDCIGSRRYESRNGVWRGRSMVENSSDWLRMLFPRWHMAVFRDQWEALAEHRPSGLPVTLVEHGTWRNGRPRWRATLADTSLFGMPMVPERPVLQDRHGRFWVSRTEWLTPDAATHAKYRDADSANALHWGAGGWAPRIFGIINAIRQSPR
jgi:hypothetical protein